MNREEKMKLEQKIKLLQFIKKIPIFSNLNEYHAKLILTICTKVVAPAGAVLCKKGDEADSMFILLTGKLVVKIDDKTVVSTITDVSSIGEMGVFTGEPRTANVEAVEKTSLLMLRKIDMDKLINKDNQFGVAIMRKVIDILAERIADDNVRLQQFKAYIMKKEAAESQ